jgi:hypothetical protein
MLKKSYLKRGILEGLALFAAAGTALAICSWIVVTPNGYLE